MDTTSWLTVFILLASTIAYLLYDLLFPRLSEVLLNYKLPPIDRFSLPPLSSNRKPTVPFSIKQNARHRETLVRILRQRGMLNKRLRPWGSDVRFLFDEARIGVNSLPQHGLGEANLRSDILNRAIFNPCFSLVRMRPASDPMRTRMWYEIARGSSGRPDTKISYEGVDGVAVEVKCDTGTLCLITRIYNAIGRLGIDLRNCTHLDGSQKHADILKQASQGYTKATILTLTQTVINMITSKSSVGVLTTYRATLILIKTGDDHIEVLPPVYADNERRHVRTDDADRLVDTTFGCFYALTLGLRSDFVNDNGPDDDDDSDDNHQPRRRHALSREPRIPPPVQRERERSPSGSEDGRDEDDQSSEEDGPALDLDSVSRTAGPRDGFSDQPGGTHTRHRIASRPAPVQVVTRAIAGDLPSPVPRLDISKLNLHQSLSVHLPLELILRNIPSESFSLYRLDKCFDWSLAPELTPPSTPSLRPRKLAHVPSPESDNGLPITEPTTQAADSDLAARDRSLLCTSFAGHGAMWDAFRAILDQSQSAVIKLCTPKLSPDDEVEDIRRQIMIDAQCLTALSNGSGPQIAPAFCGLFGNIVADVEIWCCLSEDGGDSVLTRWKGSSLNERKRIKQNILSRYDALHNHFKIVHGDPHPRNWLLDTTGEVRLVDFGRACLHAQTIKAHGGQVSTSHADLNWDEMVRSECEEVVDILRQLS
ncbi:hypothetical protein BD324DRAFT_610671 [Kockovaella imperatae]|uniref:Protein kinase domain-containing protein n=1 Tax=Kockovaella imperatae TaxID=4999 RepID=A0A1Y1U8C1_9TREE|nr:hypothetical protein BD324DRAFT_610671 [Kockovaella imperatae]ORX33365.1 hypothetical protein BD324DRAFT_610671 [Kockovaella imperatae]